MAIDAGMVTMSRDALNKALAGLTTLDEVDLLASDLTDADGAGAHLHDSMAGPSRRAA